MLRLSLRALVAYRLRLGLTATAVILGVAFVAGTLIFRDTSMRGFDKIFDGAYQGVEIVVRANQAVALDDGSARPVPESVLEKLRREVPDAASVYGAVEGYAAVVGADGSVIGGGGVAQVGGEWLDVGGAAMQVRSGRAPRGPDEIAIDANSARTGKLAVGEQVTVLSRGEPRTMLLTGVFSFPDASRLNGVMAYTAFSREVAQELLVEPGHFSSILVNGRPGVSPDRLRADVVAALPAGFEASTGNKEVEDAKAQIRELLDALQLFLLIFAGVALFVASFLIFNTFSILVVQRTRELALLRAVGASRGWVTRLVLLEATVVGLVAGTVGLAVGVGLAIGLRVLFKQFGIDLPAEGVSVSAATVLWSYGIGVLVTVVAAYFPARRGARLPPVAALGEGAAPTVRSLRWRTVVGIVFAVFGCLGLFAATRANDAGEAGFFAAVGSALVFIGAAMLAPTVVGPVIAVLGWPLTRVSRTVAPMSVGNARRDRRRTAATASALMVGLALVTMVSVLADSMKASLDAAFDREFGADFSLEPDGFSGFSAAALKDVRSTPGVRAVVPVRYGALLVGEEETPVMVADVGALAQPIRLRVREGTASLGRDEIAVQRTVAEAKGWRVGSSVPATYPDGTAVTLRVAAVLVDNQMATHPYVISPDSYSPHVSGDLVSVAYVDTDDDRAMGAALRDALSDHPNVTVQDRQQAKAKARGEVEELLGLITALLILSILIAALGIANTLSLSVIERTKEIGLLRAAGMHRRQVRRMVRYESVLIALFSTAIGIGLGLLFGWANQRASSGDGMDVLSIPVGQLSLFALSAVVIGVVAAILPARRAARMDVLHAVAAP